MNTSDKPVLRTKRPPPEREGPIRSVSMAFRAPERENSHQPEPNFIVGAVHNAYRVIDDYLKQGEEAARVRQEQQMYEFAGNHHDAHRHHYDSSPRHHPPHPQYDRPMGPDLSTIAWQSWAKMAQAWMDWAMRSFGQGMPMPGMTPWGGNWQHPAQSWGGFSWMNAPWMAMQWWSSIMSWWTQVMRMPYAMGPQQPPNAGYYGPHPGYPPHHGPHYPPHSGMQQEPSWPPYWPTQQHNDQHHGCDPQRPCDVHSPCRKPKSCEIHDPCAIQNPCNEHKKVPRADNNEPRRA